MYKWKIGDKVEILDASKIEAAEVDGYVTKGIYEVVEIDIFDNTPILEQLYESKCGLCFFDSEKPYYKLVE